MSSERKQWPRGHVVHMTVDGPGPAQPYLTQPYSVARCDCGWESRVPWSDHYREQDDAIEAHWQAVEKGEY